MNQHAEVIQLQNQQSRDNLKKLHRKLQDLENVSQIKLLKVQQRFKSADFEIVYIYIEYKHVLGEPLRAKYYGGLEKTSISHDRKYCAVIG